MLEVKAEVKAQRRPVNERKGEAWISERHRLWGWDSPFCDNDWVGVEYNNSEPVAVTMYAEWKREGERPLSDSNKKVLQEMARCPKCGFARPLFLITYRPPADYDPQKEGCFKIEPLNKAAEKYVDKLLIEHWFLDEEYHAWLYEIRGRVARDVGIIPDFLRKKGV